MNKLHDLGHVSAIGSLVKDDVDVIERGDYCFSITQVALDELRVFVYPCGFAAPVRILLKIVEHTHFPSFTDEQIDNV